jgi:osmotically-inducible protein OsmY
MSRTRSFVLLTLILVGLAATTACSMNRQTPESMDEEAMMVDVRAAIAAAVPGKTFDLGVDVTEGGGVTLTGQVNSSSDRDAIIAKVRQVNGVRSVNAAGLSVK